MDLNKITLLTAEDIGNDVLETTGNIDGYVDENGVLIVVKAQGWVSALTNHYDADAYDSFGNIITGSSPRQMTLSEKQDYCKKLILEQYNLKNPPVPERTDLGIV